MHFNSFTLIETKNMQNMQSILLIKFNISSYLVRASHSDPNRGFVIPYKEVYKVRELISSFVFPTLKYKLGI